MISKFAFIFISILSLSVLRTNAQTMNFCLSKDSVRAQQAIASKKPTILLRSGIAPRRYLQDSLVETQFGFTYEELGCAAADSDSCLEAYSKVIFANLDKQFGSVWRQTVRRDVLFLKSIQYQQKNSKRRRP